MGRPAPSFSKPGGPPKPGGNKFGGPSGGGNKFGGGGGGKDRFNRGPNKGDKDAFNVNENIRAREVRVIGPDGKMLGVYPTSQALSLARDFQLDLIEVAPDASPPTCKIMDYGKYKYEAKKKAHSNKKKQVIISVKELQIRPRTDEHDLEVKIRHARRFLLEGDKVKVSMRFQGREMANQEMGRKTMARFTAAMMDLALVESEPKSEGRQLFMIVAPDPVKIKEYKAKHPNEKPGKAPLPEELLDNTPDDDDEN
jgi:translation initiation factor IF-3